MVKATALVEHSAIYCELWLGSGSRVVALPWGCGSGKEGGEGRSGGGGQQGLPGLTTPIANSLGPSHAYGNSGLTL